MSILASPPVRAAAPATRISESPFVGWRFAIAKRDGRSTDGHRFIAFCATETERDAVLCALRLVSGKRVDPDLYYVVPRRTRGGQ